MSALRPGRRTAFDEVFLDKPSEPKRLKPNLWLDSKNLREVETLPSAVSYNPRCVYWSLTDVPQEEATSHFLVTGCPGSGKTITIRLLLQSIIPRFTDRSLPAQRMVLFDAKRDMLSILAGMGWQPSFEKLWILNPFDSRSCVWDIAADVTSEELAMHIAGIIVPDEKKASTPFFNNGGQLLVTAAIVALQEIRLKNWTLRDLIMVVSSERALKSLINSSVRAQHIAVGILEDKLHLGGIVSQIATRVLPLRVVAGIWHENRNERKFSVRKFMSEGVDAGGIALLGFHPNYEKSLRPINAMLINVMSDYALLPSHDVKNPRTWFILDEFRWLEKLEPIPRLLGQGRSKGVSVVLGVQSVEGIKVVYDDHGANELLGQCLNKTFLRAGDHVSAKWVEDHIGKVRVLRKEVSISENRMSGTTITQTDRLEDKELVLASTVLNLKTPRDGKFQSITDIPSGGTLAFADVDFQRVQKLIFPNGEVPNEVIWPGGNPPFAPWTAEERTTFLGKETKIQSEVERLRIETDQTAEMSDQENPMPSANAVALLKRVRRSDL